MYNFDPLYFNTTSFGAILIMMSFLTKTTLVQMGKENPTIDLFCLVGLVLGLIVMTYSLSMDEEGNVNLSENKTLLMFISSIVVGLSGLVMHKHMKFPVEGDYEMWIKVAFGFGMICLAYMSGLEKKKENLTMMILGSLFIIGSFLFVIPWQEKNSICNGPGLVVMMLGWILLILGNSLEVEEYN